MLIDSLFSVLPSSNKEDSEIRLHNDTLKRGLGPGGGRQAEQGKERITAFGTNMKAALD